MRSPLNWLLSTWTKGYTSVPSLHLEWRISPCFVSVYNVHGIARRTTLYVFYNYDILVTGTSDTDHLKKSLGCPPKPVDNGMFKTRQMCFSGTQWSTWATALTTQSPHFQEEGLGYTLGSSSMQSI